ncbi:1-acyl-sn-glycerol-3-phosphate acyltransferase [Teredinibacter waterburyi]|jgi:Acyltransferase.|uniref:1-acyl-sn-glycerol-3-phosphate acyltransferase n=1 Tax=Teredinibacter waterburyi TaxID=1500538 RepID=UPI00165EFB8A|nr:1-acyl-sn-glycerol-3-phosphate acyltransferase [Teredinibacter waterburyi]
MSEFDDIRPYNDEEVRPILERLLADTEFLDTLIKVKAPTLGKLAGGLLRPLVRRRLKKEIAPINSVHEFQLSLEKYLVDALNRTTTSLTYSGFEHLDPSQSYLFISNHRDIAMDPALVNWGLYQHGFSTLRIAIGDNLLTKPYASHIMRLNKSFIVKRAIAAPRERLKAAKTLSKYIHHSVVNDHENVWIAQREGRAKDGIDTTNPAIVNMIALSRDKTRSLADYIREARIVPVSISYELDPCDQAKARELYEKATEGSYVKEEHEDVRSIERGISGFKGAVHVAVGEVLDQEFDSPDEVAAALDLQIQANYVLHPSNCFAFEMLEGRVPDVHIGADNQLFSSRDRSASLSQFKEHIALCNDKWKETLLRSYANPVYRRLGEL